MKRVALVPFKSLSTAKARLAPILFLPERQALAFAMLWDVLSALRAAKGLDEVALVSSDAKALKLAEGVGARTLPEKDSPGESQSVEEASLQLVKDGADSILVIPADVPLVTPAEVETLIALDTHQPQVIMVPSRDEDGTNALLRHPPGVIRSHFGLGSFKKHRLEAEQKGVPVVVLCFPGLALDIDTPEDLALLAKEKKPCHAIDMLNDNGLLPRIQDYSKKLNLERSSPARRD